MAKKSKYIENLEYKNKRLIKFLNKLGYNNKTLSNIIHNKNECITKTETYEIIRLAMNSLEKVNDDVKIITDELYKFLDKHYDFTKFKPSETV